MTETKLEETLAEQGSVGSHDRAPGSTEILDTDIIGLLILFLWIDCIYSD